MSGTTVTSIVALPSVGPAWHLVGIRDMDYSGSADLLFQHDTGAAAAWLNDQSLGGGAASFGALPITPNPNPGGLEWHLLRWRQTFVRERSPSARTKLEEFLTR